MPSMQSGSVELLSESLQAWGALYSRKLPERAIEIWVQIFRDIDPRVLADALQLVTKTAERMPTPGHLTKAISEVREKRGVGSGEVVATYTFPKNVAIDPEIDEQVIVAIDPNPETPSRKLMFAAKDCPEGREFLNALHRFAGDKRIPFPEPKSDEDYERERQRQKLAFEERIKARI